MIGTYGLAAGCCRRLGRGVLVSRRFTRPLRTWSLGRDAQPCTRPVASQSAAQPPAEVPQWVPREANRLLGTTGEPFWQRESYDHWVRDDAEWKKIATYIENNPVRAGLVTRADQFLWSSANGRWQGGGKASGDRSVDAARTSACATNTRQLLVAQDLHRLYARGAQGGEQGGERGHGQDHCDHGR